MNTTNISNNSKRVAKNTLVLYFRMLLLMFVGLFTARIILQSLGVSDYGTFNAVAGMVTLFAVFTGALSTAISRCITYRIGNGNKNELSKVFASSIGLLLLFGAVVVILIETLGLWFLNTGMDIPQGRMHAAGWVLHCSAFILLFNTLSIPFTATILAHEDMQVYAAISILEACIKLGIAFALKYSTCDKLILYAILMAVSAFLIRLSYASYCHRHYDETKSGIGWDRSIFKEIASFAGWSSISSGVFIVNTQGLNLLTNVFFGVAANAARGVAAQVEGIVKQFVNNVVIALNPQITKSYAAGDKEYSFTLVSKGSKYAFLIMFAFIAPSLSETQTLLEIWLGTVPEQAALFTQLTLICAAADLLMTTFSTLILSDGRIRTFYSVIGAVSVLIFPITWIAFKMGAAAFSAYLVFTLIYLILDAIKLIIVHNTTGYPYGLFFREVLARVAIPSLLCLASCFIVKTLLPEPTVGRLFITAAGSFTILAVSCYFFALTPGERAFVNSKIHIKHHD